MKKWQNSDGDLSAFERRERSRPLHRRTAYRAEPYGYQDPGVPQGDQTQRPDGFDPYRTRTDEHPHNTAAEDRRSHRDTTSQRYGAEPERGPKKPSRFQSENDD